MTSFFELFQEITPSWLHDGEGGGVLASLALMKDDFKARAKLALMTRFPSYAVDDAALAAIGRDRKIIRGINEPAASYAARLVQAPDDHRTRGNPFALLKQLRGYLQAPCVVRTVDRRGNWYSIDADGNHSASINTANWDWDGLPASPQWGRYWVIIYPVDGTTPWAPAGKIGDPDLWGTGLIGGDPQATIGTTATVDQVASVKSIIREWKPAGMTCEWVIIAFDAASFSPAGSTDPAGLWANWSDGAGNPRRLTSARYWRVG